MNKQEFLSELRRNLVGEVPGQEVDKNIAYYEEYISSDGSESEQCRIDEIGDPRLIARTIIETYKISHKTYQTHASDTAYAENVEDDYDSMRNTSEMGGENLFKIPLKVKVWGIVSVIILVFLLYWILKAVSFVAVKIVLPVVIVALVFSLVMRLFKK